MKHRGFTLAILVVAACGGYDGAPMYGTSGNSSGAAKLAFLNMPASVTAATTITPAIQVAIQDASGIVVANSTVNVTIALTPGTGAAGAVLSGTLTRAAVAGYANFTDLKIDKTGTGYSFTATSTGLTAATSSLFAVTP